MDKIKKALEQAREKRANVPNLSREALLQPQFEDEFPVQTDFVTETAFPVFKPDSNMLDKHRILHDASEGEVLQPFKVLRTRLSQLMQDNDWTTIAVMSPAKDDGKTTVAINLSISIAHGMHSSAVLLDLDLINPSIHTYFGYEPTHGLDDYYLGKTNLRDVLISPGLDNLLLAPTKNQLTNSSEYLASTRSNALISDIQQINQNSKIIIDLPPLLSSDDAIAFIPYIDAVLLVVREGKTKKEDIQQAIELLGNTKLAGVVLNDAQGSSEYGYN